MIKVEVFTCSISKMSGGLLDAVRDLYLHVNNKKTKITIYSYWDKETKNDLASWFPLPIKLYHRQNGFFYSKKVKNDLLSKKTDVLHIHGLWRYPHFFVNMWIRKKKGHVVVSPHGMLDPYIIQNQGFVKRLLAKLLFPKPVWNSVSCYIALCEAEYRAIRDFGITSPVAIIPNGINLPVLESDTQHEKDHKHLLFLGRLHPKKGVDILLKSIAQIKKQNPELLANWVVDIVGWSQENFDKQLQSIVDENDLHKIVTFHGGLFDAEKEKMYAKASAYILPSHGEGLPMTVLEAWAWELPVVMTPMCNIPEGYQHNAAIKIYPEKKSVTKGLLELMKMNSAERLEMGKRGRQLVKHFFTWEASAQKIDELYQWLSHQDTYIKPAFVKAAKKNKDFRS